MAKRRYLIGGLVIVVSLVIGGYAFLRGSVKYATFGEAERSGKRVQVAGTWIRERGSVYDPRTNTFAFSMRDGENREAEIVLHGPKPNNFDLAENLVVKGRFENGTFHATQVLTKCPSKYTGEPSPGHPEGIPKENP
ncbi:MAG: cytochrome c maturation protein CcmE [Bacteroidota bacterium]|nr:cytochrome c maturation protein CcmE [Bacteroidota bacterium]